MAPEGSPHFKTPAGLPVLAANVHSARQLGCPQRADTDYHVHENRVKTATDSTSRVIAYGYFLDCVVHTQADPDGTVAASAVACPDEGGDNARRLLDVWNQK